MAIARIDYFSDCLKRLVPVNVIIPIENDGKDNVNYKRNMRTLILLHGYNGNCSDWMYHSQLVNAASDYNLCIVIPEGENSFYLDGPETGRKYGTFVGQELLELIHKTFHLSTSREDTYIGGFSMGGFGAIHTALQFPDTFSKLIAFSSAYIIHRIDHMKPGTFDGIANYDYYTLAFGDLTKIVESENNPEVLVEKLIKENKDIPKILMTCGHDDFMVKENREFAQFLKDHKVDMIYEESDGIHDFNFWNKSLIPAIEWLVKE